MSVRNKMSIKKRIIKTRDELNKLRVKISEECEKMGLKSVAERMIMLDEIYEFALNWAYECANNKITKGSSSALNLMQQARLEYEALDSMLARQVANEEGTGINAGTGITIIEERNYPEEIEA